MTPQSFDLMYREMFTVQQRRDTASENVELIEHVNEKMNETN